MATIAPRKDTFHHVSTSETKSAPFVRKFTTTFGSVQATVDTGATLDACSATVAEKHPELRRRLPHSFKAASANGEVTLRDYLELPVDDPLESPSADPLYLRFFILPDLPFDYLIGRPTIRRLGGELIWKTQRGTFRHSANDAALDEPDSDFPNFPSACPTDPADHSVLALNAQDFERGALDAAYAPLATASQRHFDRSTHQYVAEPCPQPKDLVAPWSKPEEILQTCAHIPRDPELLEEIRATFWQYHSSFAKDEFDVGTVPDVEFTIELTDEKKFVNSPVYSLNQHDNAEVNRQVDTWLKAGICRPSRSRFGSPVILVSKPHSKEKRLCIDLRRVNNLTVKNRYPIPNLHELVRSLGKSSWFTAFDLRAGYLHIAIAEKDRHKTAFKTRKGLFELNKMGFGFSNAPPFYQEVMNNIFGDLPNVSVYLDDLLVHTTGSFADHWAAVKVVLKRFADNEMKLNFAKCQFFQRKLTYLGHVIAEGRVSPDPEYRAKILDFPRPTSRKDVQRLVGLAQWIAKFIPNLSSILRPLGELTRKSPSAPATATRKSNKFYVKFEWTRPREAAYQSLRRAVRDTKYLLQPDESKPFFLETDASDYAIGAVLLQHHKITSADYADKTVLWPVEFHSKKLGKYQKGWHVSEKELFAVVDACRKWRHFLVPRPFVVYTDHRNLVYLLSDHRKPDHGRLDRWALLLWEFDFEARYLPGPDNIVADFLSREGCVLPNKATLPADTIAPLRLLNVTSSNQTHHLCVLTSAVADAPAQSDSSAAAPRHPLPAVMEAARAPAALARHLNDVLQDVERHDQSRQQPDPDASRVDEAIRLIKPTQQLSAMLSSAEFLAAQREDPFLGRLVQHFESPTEHPLSSRPIRCLPGAYRSLAARNCGFDEVLQTKTAQWIAPASLRPLILDYFHSLNHDGAERVLANIRPRFYWPGLPTDVKEFVRTCKTCQASKPLIGGAKQGLPQAWPAFHVFEQVHVDIVGPLPQSDLNVQNLLTMQDRFSRWTEVAPLPDTRMETVSLAFYNHWVLRWGTPESVLSDRGSNFIGELTTTLLRLLQVKIKTTCPVRPQTNGQLERFHRYLKTALRSRALERAWNLARGSTPWELVLPSVVSVYNTTKGSATGFSPYELIRGERFRFPVDLQRKLDSVRLEQFDPDSETPANLPRAEYHRFVNLLRMHRMSKENLALAHLLPYERRKLASQTRHRSKHHYKAGDFVLLRRLHDKGNQKKFRPTFHPEPFKVVRLDGHMNLVLQPSSGDGREVTHHVNHVRPFHRRSERLRAKRARASSSALRQPPVAAAPVRPA